MSRSGQGATGGNLLKQQDEKSGSGVLRATTTGVTGTYWGTA